MLELDLLFARFIKNGGLCKLNDAQLQSYSELLEMDDGDLLLLLQGKECQIKLDLCMQSIVNMIILVNGESYVGTKYSKS